MPIYPFLESEDYKAPSGLLWTKFGADLIGNILNALQERKRQKTQDEREAQLLQLRLDEADRESQRFDIETANEEYLSQPVDVTVGEAEGPPMPGQEYVPFKQTMRRREAAPYLQAEAEYALEAPGRRQKEYAERVALENDVLRTRAQAAADYARAQSYNEPEPAPSPMPEPGYKFDAGDESRIVGMMDDLSKAIRTQGMAKDQTAIDAARGQVADLSARIETWLPHIQAISNLEDILNPDNGYSYEEASDAYTQLSLDPRLLPVEREYLLRFAKPLLIHLPRVTEMGG